MNSFLKGPFKYLILAIGVAVVAACSYGYFDGHIQNIEQNSQAILNKIGITQQPAPCSQPITYTIGTFDTGFGLTQAEFLADINQAIQIWDKPFNKTFFVLATTSPNGTPEFADLKINLIYDYRQEATDAMNSIGISINNQTTVYNALNQKYTSLTTEYAQAKAQYTAAEAAFETAEDTYNQQVNYWNGQGGAPTAQYAQLQQENNTLQQQADSLNQSVASLNTEAADIDSTSATINKYAALLNSEASQYNTIGSSTGEEFDEGEYVQDESGDHIDIYQYDSHDKLIRVLAHELGHALGLGHVYGDPQSIMYPLNQGAALKLSSEDIAELNQVCNAKQ